MRVHQTTADDANGDHWPLLEVAEPSLDEIAARSEAEAADRAARERKGNTAQWGDDDGLGDADLDDFSSPSGRKSLGMSPELAGDEWGDDADLDLDVGGSPMSLDEDDAFMDSADGSTQVGGSGMVAPSAGIATSAYWSNNSSVAADHVSAGDFESAMQLLNRQIGIVNFAPMKSLFMQIYGGSSGSLPTFDSMPSLRTSFERSDAGTKQALPTPVISMGMLTETLQNSYRAFTAAKFDLVKSGMEFIIRAIPLLVVNSREEVNQVKDLLNIVQQYLLSVMIREAVVQNPLDQNPQRNVELNAYFTHLNLQPSHVMLTLKIAMMNAFKSQNFISAASFSRRLLEQPDIRSERHAKLRSTAKKVLQRSEKEARNASQLDYNDKEPFDIDAESLSPIYKGTPKVKCPFCGSVYKASYKGKLCRVCNLAKVGVETLGFVLTTEN